MDRYGLFLGLSTIDVIHLVKELPRENQKITALRQLLAAGGPSTNAAVAFSHLGGTSLLVTSLGSNALAGLVVKELKSLNVRVHDLSPAYHEQPAVSSITV